MATVADAYPPSSRINSGIGWANADGTAFPAFADSESSSTIQAGWGDGIGEAWLAGIETSEEAVGNNVFLTVASSLASTAIKSAADFVCDGVSDNVQINSALNQAYSASAGGFGKVQLTGGWFDITAPVLERTGVWLGGCGPRTELRARGLTTDAGAGTGTAIIKAYDINTHMTYLSDMWINGNYSTGGTGHGVYLAASSSGDSHSGYPDTNPDPDHNIRNLFISGMMSGTRHGLYMGDDCRGTIVHNLQIRNCSGYGIFFESAPDSHISSVHCGGCAISGYRINGGNVKLSNCKAFYCDLYGFDIVSGRGSLSACEAQDNANGFRFSGTSYTAVGLIADTSLTNSIEINASYGSITGFAAFNRGNGRYPTTSKGLVFSGTPANVQAIGVVNPSNLTTAVSGTYATAGNYVRVSSNGTVIATG